MSSLLQAYHNSTFSKYLHIHQYCLFASILSSYFSFKLQKAPTFSKRFSSVIEILY
ncbi:hypothetical protein GCWU000321_00300 [Dialister invisus DSM 15470]|uniref:Uncharacterized protein n=1 Tax=Dialister invisus DSM 15470 TaxID=592028 RepID=C9LLF4_9FIRM|nr:hypothetical protein GCWU000321_00300 [Dialister invisus DSM 15470]